MKILINEAAPVKIVPVFEDEIDALPLAVYAHERKLFDAKPGETYADTGRNGTDVLLAGMGKQDDLSYDRLRLIAFKAARAAEAAHVEGLHIDLPVTENLCYFKTARALAEGFHQADYRFDKFLSEKKPRFLQSVSFGVNERTDDVREGIEEAEMLIRGIFLTRELVNEPAMYMYPKTLAARAVEELTPLGVDVRVMNKDEIKKIGMKAFLAVARGSSRSPKFILMEYHGNPASKERHALIGKGLTYDSGGYCLKPPNGMADMHADMGGAGTVIGAMRSIAEAKLKVNVVAAVAACENMISGKAYKTGDIIGSLAGKTIEVNNTDAEGRLTLADALYYVADRYEPASIIDLATLTGACVAALGELYAGAVTNAKPVMDAVRTAADEAGECVWELPVSDDYRDLIKSKTADLSNTGVRGAGSITAGLFLEHFVKDLPWVHLDIAGTAYTTAETGYLPVGATGHHVKTLFYYFKNMQA